MRNVLLTAEENDLHADYLCTITPNRSLSLLGRRLWLVLIALAVLINAVGATALGAWPVMPFAGLEVLLVWWAFRNISKRDCDFESLSINGDWVRFSAREGRVIRTLEGNRQWVRLEQVFEGARCALTLIYAGQRCPIGRLLSDEQRKGWAAELKGCLGVLRKPQTRGRGQAAGRGLSGF